MVHRIRVAIVGAVAVTAAIALAGSGLASAAMERVGTVVLPASAAVHPTEVDVTGRFRSDPGWGIAQGAIVPAPAPGVAAGSRMLARRPPAPPSPGPWWRAARRCGTSSSPGPG
jgi:hypothetical protein